MKLFLSPLVFLVLLAACQSDQFEQVGYFKGDNRNRVFVLRAIEDVNEAQVAKRVSSLAHSDDRMTLAYVYPNETEGLKDVVTLASSFVDANDAMFQSPVAWRWWYRQAPNGDITLIDCYETPGSTTCKNAD